MTEDHWLTCVRAQCLLNFLKGDGSDRKLRLFACACCRRVWDEHPDLRCRAAVETAERFADGLATPEELKACYRPARFAYRDYFSKGTNDPRLYRFIAAADTAGKDAWGVAFVTHNDAAWPLTEGCRPNFYDEVVDAAHAGIVRDLFGNPFRPAPFVPAWQTPAAVEVARSMYATRRFDRMPVLADAIEDAGCDDADVLAHCRGPGPHYRGCWVVDVVLGKG